MSALLLYPLLVYASIQLSCQGVKMSRLQRSIEGHEKMALCCGISRSTPSNNATLHFMQQFIFCFSFGRNQQKN